jgi:hypothetical protein
VIRCAICGGRVGVTGPCPTCAQRRQITVGFLTRALAADRGVEIDRRKIARSARPSVSALAAYLATQGAEWMPAPFAAAAWAQLIFEDGECFENATRLVEADPTLRYVEGVGITTDHLACLHAWAVTPAGVVIDPTWDVPEQHRYFGVAYVGTPFRETHPLTSVTVARSPRRRRRK